jgi:hypothetical protein
MGTWRALIWKEWLGLRWKLAALGAMPAAMLLFEAAYDPALIPVAFVAAVMAYAAIAPIFLAMPAAAVERADGTLEFVRGLPCDRRKMGLVRVLATLAALLAPLVGAVVLAYGLLLATSHWNSAPLREFTDAEGAGIVSLCGVGITASLYLWTTALAMNERSELRAGVIGVGTVVVLGGLTIFLMVLADRWEHVAVGSRWLCVVAGVGPFGSLIAVGPPLPTIERVLIVLIQVVTALLLLAVAVNRYANLERSRWGNRLRLSGAARALIWAQWRQVVALGVLAILMVLALSLMSDSTYVLAFVGSVWAVVAGVTLFTAEFEPRLYTFWRSRPIDPSAWFRIKYTAGLLTLLVCFDLPAALLGQAHPSSRGDETVFIAYALCVPAVHVATYSIAVMIVCLVRQAIYAGIFSMSALMALTLVPLLQRDHRIMGQVLDAQSMLLLLIERGYQHRMSAMLLNLMIYLMFNAMVTAAAVVAAWWSVRFDVALRA